MYYAMESSLECGVCFSCYNSDDNRPKSLPCGHSICGTCVKDSLVAKNGRMDCPFCRSPCGTGIKTLDDFPTTFALLGLLNTAEPKNPLQTLSPREKDKNILRQRKQAEFDRTEAQLSNCNEHLEKLLQSKEKQESVILSINLGEKKLLEDYQREQKRLEEERKKATSMNDQLEDIVAEGNDIVKGLEALKDRVTSASSLPGLNLASQDVQRYCTVSQDWITSKVTGILKEDTYLKKQVSGIKHKKHSDLRSGMINQPSLRFHHICGKNIRIKQGGSVARRVSSFFDAVTFSSRPFYIGERVRIRLLETKKEFSWSGSLKLGFTSQDPARLKDTLPNDAAELNKKAGYWVKPLEDKYPLKLHDTGLDIVFFVTSIGQVHVGINGIAKGVLLDGVDPINPLYAIIDITGNAVAVEFLDS